MKIFQQKKIEDLRIFSGIDKSVISEIIDGAKRDTFLPGETIIEQGEIPNGEGYIIENGEVDVYVNSELTSSLFSGDIFGEIALLNEEERSASVVSKKETTVIIITQDMLIEMINQDNNSINKEIIRRIEENLENEQY